MQKLSTLLTQGFGLNLNGWIYLNGATWCHDSGLVIAGRGIGPTGLKRPSASNSSSHIYVNWYDPISSSFEGDEEARSLGEYVVTAPGSWQGMDWMPSLPNGMTPDEYKDQVMSELREIMVASGDMHEIDLLDSRYE